MQSLESVDNQLDSQYMLAADALYEIGVIYFYHGRLQDAQRVLHSTLQVFEAEDIKLRHRLHLLLLYGQILAVNLLITRKNEDMVLAIAFQAREMAEKMQDQQMRADALSLLGHVHYCTTLTARLSKGNSPDCPQEQGQFAEALAYQQQALALREELHDTRGMSESYFNIGAIYERWQQMDQALDYYQKARHLADQYEHRFEKTEPTRHLAVHALRQGDLGQALPLALRALQLREEAGFRPYLPFDHLLLRSIYLALNDEPNAQLHTQKATDLAQEMGYPQLVSSLPDLRTLLSKQSE